MARQINSHKDLHVWQRSMDLVTEIYRMTAAFPASERFGLTTQLRRAAVSIPTNIAEGSARTGPREFGHFVSIARGSAAELETLLEISQRLAFTTSATLENSNTMLDTVNKMLTMLRRRLT